MNRKSSEVFLRPVSLASRLVELAKLADGWLDGVGLRLPSAGLDWLTAAWLQECSRDVPEPLAFPTKEGGIELQWHLARDTLYLEVDLARHKAELVVLNDSTERIVARDTFDLSAARDWQAIVNVLRLAHAESPEKMQVGSEVGAWLELDDDIPTISGATPVQEDVPTVARWPKGRPQPVE
jgi:hypothetical protein